METRLILETEQFIRADESASYEEIDRLEFIIADSMKEIQTGSFKKSTVGFSFQMEIARISKNEVLYKILEAITLEQTNVREATMMDHSKEDLIKEINKHKNIIASIKNRKSNEAKNAMHKHLSNDLISLQKNN